jgi:hypothetical protein
LKSWKDGTVHNRLGLDTKDAFKKFREDKLNEYNLKLSPYQLNGLTYVEGEINDYSSKRRVMNELAAFYHQCDNWSARAWYDYLKPAGIDKWIGADRIKAPE